MNRLYIYCEGKTEKQFVDVVLKNYLESEGLIAIPLIAGDCRNSNHGGVTGYTQVKREIVRLCKEHRNEYVTTMVDLAPNFAKEFKCSGGSPHE